MCMGLSFLGEGLFGKGKHSVKLWHRMWLFYFTIWWKYRFLSSFWGRLCGWGLLLIIPVGFQEIKQQPFPMIQPSVKIAVKKTYLLGSFGGCFWGVRKKRLTFIPRFAKDFFMHGVVAQLGERLNGIQEAVSSILSSSTRFLKNPRSSHRWSGVWRFERLLVEKTRA